MEETEDPGMAMLIPGCLLSGYTSLEEQPWKTKRPVASHFPLIPLSGNNDLTAAWRGSLRGKGGPHEGEGSAVSERRSKKASRRAWVKQSPS